MGREGGKPMYEIEKERFGTFLHQLRRERGMTQKELAQQLYVSDKAVSKWERGLSLPDVTLLLPLADCLGVSVTELLRGERNQTRELPVEEVEALVNASLRLSEGEQRARAQRRRRWQLAFVLCALAGLVQTVLLLTRGGYGWTDLEDTVILVELLSLLFGAYLCFGAKEQLPAYYDQNRISSYSDGPFRMNLPGVRFHNSNWPHILNAMRGWLLGALTLFPALWWGLRHLWPGLAGQGERFLALAAMLGMLLAATIVGKRYE
ncbi:helix-turn-helix domain-containing protein [Pseudoflavonifractor sp. MCC625]|nr:helix-turn-helix domain-containing protein [Pseudoflavonifractor sp. MCC625]